jgi:hypothetical protein
MDAAIEKVKELMASLGVTLEHLGMSSPSAIGKKSKAKKVATTRAAPERAGVGVPKYMDPKTGKTWTGFGRAPGWIHGVKNRDAFLVGKSTAASASSIDAKVAAKKPKVRKVKAVAPAKNLSSARTAKGTAPTKAVAPAKKAAAKRRSAKVPTAKRPAAKKQVTKKLAKKKTLAPVASAPTSKSDGDASVAA